MRVLFDTHVILDLLLDRQPHSEIAAALVARVERQELTGYVCATTITTLFYLASRVVGADAARGQIRQLFRIFAVAPVSASTLELALDAGFSDFEDAVLHEAARHAGAQGIVTRNVRDFKSAVLAVYLPGELEALMRVSE